ncbi:VENN motif pre-toxin domain-containing protein [Pelistega sp. NLN82]|uniref:VENN motif pre-toxin domain-containing protein n=1 Tax=Pelistega ratti TaxID=2652177 RepID=A0A6L9Y5H5_9BURK|nr:VENN motif pre-toxin domain-containing protein [Pelistega ratti]NEN75603.1 VENN motif pre-toxin domain-containing protein [Pelistega ratti]
MIDSTADKNTFTTKTLTVENILNQSEIKVQSASVGVSTNLEANKLAAVGTVASAVGGNIHQEDSSTTYSVIGQNISLNVKEGSIPDHLRRDKEGANNKVQLFDKADAQERMEMAQVIGEISQNTITIALQPMLDKAEADKAEAEKALKDESLSPKEKAYYTNQVRVAQETLHTYGKGSDLQLGIRDATGVLQGLATGNTNAAIVGGLSPFLNKAIKEATTDKATNKVNLFANTVAHAILGAVEAKMLNTNVAAGAAGAVVGETTAHIIADKLYQKSPEALTEQEKETISALSQVVAGLSGVAVGDNLQSAVVSSEIGKRAVENNALVPNYGAWSNISNWGPGATSLVQVGIKNGKTVEQINQDLQAYTRRDGFDAGMKDGILVMVGIPTAAGTLVVPGFWGEYAKLAGSSIITSMGINTLQGKDYTKSALVTDLTIGALNNKWTNFLKAQSVIPQASKRTNFVAEKFIDTKGFIQGYFLGEGISGTLNRVDSMSSVVIKTSVFRNPDEKNRFPKEINPTIKKIGGKND